MTITPINPNDKSWTRHRYVLWFGAYGTIHLLVWANSLEDALDECIDWIADNAPGLLMDEAVNEAFQEARAKGMSEEEAWDESQTDMTCGGNAGNFIASWEWGIDAEDPTREDILRMQGRTR